MNPSVHNWVAVIEQSKGYLVMSLLLSIMLNTVSAIDSKPIISTVGVITKNRFGTPCFEANAKMPKKV